ncbi:hypothetical protein [Fibrivirga algicola]|uniref:Uncharacterized protein n=1 Tax=Fibrivirga algicola TaxID=2950420 RepID=A0ABX0QN44_9BACT|nr:hypothetical protein [Fibrivirga algicola]NID13759.1 hypothetical protein [Fibrivirga algicola]
MSTCQHAPQHALWCRSIHPMPKPDYTAWYRHDPHHGLDHYYLQRPDAVVHVLTTDSLINLLPLDHLQHVASSLEPITLEQFGDVFYATVQSLMVDLEHLLDPRPPVPPPIEDRLN